MRTGLLIASVVVGLCIIAFSPLLWPVYALVFATAGMFYIYRKLRPCQVPMPEIWPPVTIVVPMRNEERHVLQALNSFSGLQYDNLEVLIVNDCSTDNTETLAKNWLSTYRGPHTIKLLNAPQDPPLGWIGQTFASNYAITDAKGDIILSCDADVVHTPESLRHSVAHFLSARASLLSRIPHLVIKHPGEYPFLLHVFILRFSSWLSRLLGSRQSFAMGTYLMFSRNFYERSGGWNKNREYPESLALLNYALAHGDTFILFDEVSTEVTARYYRGARETARGMLRNMNIPLLQPLPFLMAFLIIGINCSAIFNGAAALRAGTAAGVLTVPLIFSIFFGVHLFISAHSLKTVVQNTLLTPALLWYIACMGILGAVRIVVPFRLTWRGRSMGTTLS